MTATSHARRDDSHGIITVTFTRDEKRNAISGEMFDVLESAVSDLADDDRHRVLVLTGEGRYFTAGVDIAELAGPLGEGTDGVVRGSNVRRQYRRNARQLIDGLARPVARRLGRVVTGIEQRDDSTQGVPNQIDGRSVDDVGER